MSATNLLIDDLERALANGTDAYRLEMLSRVTDLFFAGASRYSASQIRVFDEVIAKLAAAIEPMARAKLASRLAPTPNAPAGVIRQLAFDDNIEVARPVLRLSERLTDTDLIDNANLKSQRHLAAIAERRTLNEPVTDILVARGDRTVVHSVSKNLGARISPGSFRVLVRKASDDDELAIQLGAREDIPRQLFMRLIEEASAAVRARLMAENITDAPAIDAAVREVSTSIRVDAQKVTNDNMAARARLEALHRQGKLGESDVLGFTRVGQLAETIVALSLLGSVTQDVAERAFVAPGPDMLLILAKLAGFSWTAAKALLLLKTGDRPMSEQEIEEALASFERLQIGTARKVLGFYHSRAGAVSAARA